MEMSRFVAHDSAMTRIVFFLIFGLALSSLRAGEASAFTALREARKVAGGAQLSAMTGTRGGPQPSAWKVVFSDPSLRGGVKEVVVTDGEVTEQRTPQHGYAGVGALPTIDITRLKFDSTAAFVVANQQARKQKLGFNWINYDLRPNNVSGVPEWDLTLLDHMGARVGVIHLSAEDGSILMPLEVGMPPVETSDRGDEDDDDKKIGGLIGTVRDTATDFGTKVSDTTLRTVGTVEKFLTGERTIGPRDSD